MTKRAPVVLASALCLLFGGSGLAAADTTVVNPPPVTVTATPPPLTVTFAPPPPPVTTTVTAPPVTTTVTTTVTAPPTTTTTTPTTTTPPPPPPCGGPITITAGGTYSGCYQSNDANVPAVRISTTAPVTLSRAHIIAKGIGVSAWFDTNGGGARLTITDSTFDQLDPGAVVRHRAVQMFLPGSLVFTNNKLTDTDGVWLAGMDRQPTPMGQFVFNNNLITNVGRYPHPLDTGCCVQALQLSSVLVPGGQIWWNKITNAPGKSDVEDNISLYESGGTDATHRIDVGYNLVDGAYPRALNNSGYTGGGINMGDGGGGSGAGIVGQHNTAHDNTVVSVTNYGISVNGTDNYANNNVLVNDGAEQRTDFGQAFMAWPQVTPSGIHADGTNKVNWHRFVGDTTQWPCYVNTYCATTQVSTTEQQARDAWEARRAAASVAIGPR